MSENYSDDWKEDCLEFHRKILTGEKAHWCPEWDYLPIDETCFEFEMCRCDLSNTEEGNDNQDTLNEQ